MTNLNNIMDRIEELLEDKNETVTYIMLSEEFKITTINAREIMEKYVQKRKERDPDSIGLLYVVYGITKAEGRNFVAVMTPIAMEEQKEKLNDCHSMLLSIYKTASNDGSRQPDPFGIFRATKSPLSGCIVSRNAVKRKLKLHPTDVEPSTKKDIDTKKACPNVDRHNNGNKKQNGLGNFLSKAPIKTEIEKKPAPKPKAKNVMTSFFSKAPTKSTDAIKQNSNPNGGEDKKREISPVAEKIEIIDDIEMKPEEKNERKNGQKHKLIDTDDSEDDVSPTKKSNVTIEKKTQKKKRPRNEKKNNEQHSKKRRRIISDAENSDSDDIFGSDKDEKEDEDVIEMSDTEEVKVVSTAAKNTRKVRKQVSDMFLEEEDGYFQTVNKWEYESASDKEEEKEQKPDNTIQSKNTDNTVEKKTETSKKLNVSPQKSVNGVKGKKAIPQNQTSIMNFFKKK